MFSIFTCSGASKSLKILNEYNLFYATLKIFQNPEQTPALVMEILVCAATILALTDNASVKVKCFGATLNLLIGLYYVQNITPTNPQLLLNVLDTIASLTCSEMIILDLATKLHK